MTAPELAAWQVFYNTTADSAATLAGLVMVAVSVNVRQILAHKHLPARAFAAICGLMLTLVTCLLGQVPQPLSSYTLELIFAAAFAWVLFVTTAIQVISGHIRIGRPRHETAIGTLLGLGQVLPLTIGVALLVQGHAEGLYWVAATMAASLVVSVINGWVLLVEILR